MLNIPLNMIRAFAAVFDAGGIRPAARNLGVTHTSVLRFVRELEAHLGIELTKQRKGSRGILFTPSGEALGKAALASLAELESAVNAIREAHHRKSVNIETTPSVASRWLLPRLSALEEALGGVEVSLIVDQRLRSSEESGADITIRLGNGPWPGVDCDPLMDDALIPVMSPAYWRLVNEPVDPDALKGCRLIHDRDPNASWSAWKAAFGPDDLDIRSGSRFSSADLVLTAAEQSLGVAFARRSLAKEAMIRGHLIAPFGDLCVLLPNSVWILLPTIVMRRQAVTKVIDWLHAEAATQHTPEI